MSFDPSIFNAAATKGDIASLTPDVGDSLIEMTRALVTIQQDGKDKMDEIQAVKDSLDVLMKRFKDLSGYQP